MEENQLEKLTEPARQFLKVLRMFNDKPMTLYHYSLMVGRSRRWVRYLVSELRTKGYVRVEPENMRIHKSNHCRYFILANEDGVLLNKESIDNFINEGLSDDIKKRLDLK